MDAQKFRDFVSAQALAANNMGINRSDCMKQVQILVLGEIAAQLMEMNATLKALNENFDAAQLHLPSNKGVRNANT